jgi:hypothetical protein
VDIPVEGKVSPKSLWTTVQAELLRQRAVKQVSRMGASMVWMVVQTQPRKRHSPAIEIDPLR